MITNIIDDIIERERETERENIYHFSPLLEFKLNTKTDYFVIEGRL